jgi:uncharacterized protein (DUF433 family)
MQRTIEMTEAEELQLQELARQAGQDVDSLLRSLVAVLGQAGDERQAALSRWLQQNFGAGRKLQGEKPVMHLHSIQSTPAVMGGDACIRDTRIPVWLLVEYKRQGMTDSELLQSYPSLNAADLIAAWDYFAANSQEIERQMQEHEEAA